MKRVLLSVVCCAMLVSVAGAATPGNAPIEKVQIAITTKQSNAAAIPIAVKAGDEFVVTLDSNATTGYKWQLSGKPNGKIVTFVKSIYNAPSQAIPGKGGTESWSFKAVGKGSATITLAYARPWERGVAPVRVQRFDVGVR